MRSPADMSIIQIELTNKCFRKCSNCTRLVGHHKSPFFMDFETFKKAVDSLIEFPGMIGIMGGEPTLHPQFREFIEYYVSKIPQKSRRGLWTSLPKSYYDHYDLIKATFGYECINDHVHPSLHQPLLVAIKDVIKDERLMWKLIDQCWIQNLWSASVTPKGAFFCEVAAAFDILFDGPGGWPIEPGWWKRKPTDPEFIEQVRRWCPRCGAACPLDRRKTDEEIDDVSLTNYIELKVIGSTKKMKVYDTENYDLRSYLDRWHPSAGWYVEDDSQRISQDNLRKIHEQESRKRRSEG